MINKFNRIKMLLLDVDGVLTAGEIIYADNGAQIKVFNVKDGVGIRLLKEAGIQVGIITGRTGKALRHRCNNLGIDMIFDGIHNKAKVLDEIIAQTGIPREAVAFMGDDLPDLSIMKKAGVAIAVADAHEMVKKTAHMTTQAPGGQGAVREISETILKSQNLWTPIIQRLFQGE